MIRAFDTSAIGRFKHPRPVISPDVLGISRASEGVTHDAFVHSSMQQLSGLGFLEDQGVIAKRRIGSWCCWGCQSKITGIALVVRLPSYLIRLKCSRCSSVSGSDRMVRSVCVRADRFGFLGFAIRPISPYDNVGLRASRIGRWSRAPHPLQPPCGSARFVIDYTRTRPSTHAITDHTLGAHHSLSCA